MRTTVDLPDELLRRTKAAAALNGMRLKEFLALVVERGLTVVPSGEFRSYGQHRPIPVKIPYSGSTPFNLTNKELADLEIQEERDRLGRH